MTHKISMAAFEAAGDPGKHPEAGPVWQPQKIYYNQGFNRPRTEALHEGLLERGMDSPYGEWLERWKSRGMGRDREITTYVPCGEYFEIRDKALLAHATQIDPDGGWFRVPIDVQREIWPTEEYELAKSLVDTSLPEDDLFAGIRDN
jgi:mycothiol S-conjugate amidase